MELWADEGVHLVEVAQQPAAEQQTLLTQKIFGHVCQIDHILFFLLFIPLYFVTSLYIYLNRCIKSKKISNELQKYWLISRRRPRAIC